MNQSTKTGSAKKRISIEQARSVAGEIIASISDCCKRIEIAGSVRRQKLYVNDIEIIAIASDETRQITIKKQPKTPCLFNPHAEQTSTVSALEARLRECYPDPRKNGPKQKQFIVDGIQIDLFIVTPETWGTQFLIRTGPKDFSRKIVTRRRLGGALPNEMVWEKGRIRHQSWQVYLTPEEADVFARLGLPWLEPHERDLSRLEHEIANL